MLVPAAGRPNQGLRKIARCEALALYQEEHHQRCSSDELTEETVNHL